MTPCWSTVTQVVLTTPQSVEGRTTPPSPVHSSSVKLLVKTLVGGRNIVVPFFGRVIFVLVPPPEDEPELPPVVAVVLGEMQTR